MVAAQPQQRLNRDTEFSSVQAGQGLLLAALDHLKEPPAADAAASRVGVLYNPTDAAAEPSLLTRLLLATTELTSRRPKIAGKTASSSHCESRGSRGLSGAGV